MKRLGTRQPGSSGPAVDPPLARATTSSSEPAASHCRKRRMRCARNPVEDRKSTESLAGSG